MYCPFCQKDDTKVIDSRLIDEGARVKRRRECLGCHERFSTYEVAELIFPRVVKRDGRCCEFDPEKVKHGIVKALEKRPINMQQITEAWKIILQKLRARGEQEVTTREIGELVMEQLRKLDEVGYVRFASVYRSFQDVNEFNEEIQRMQKEKQDHDTNEKK